jgi:uncharacterized protein YgiM (DUF1202 family)
MKPMLRLLIAAVFFAILTLLTLAVQIARAESAPLPINPQFVPGPVSTTVRISHVVRVAQANIRSGPGVGYAAITRVQAGAELLVIGQARGWYKVRHEGKIGFIKINLVDTHAVTQRIAEPLQAQIACTQTKTANAGTCLQRAITDPGAKP